MRLCHLLILFILIHQISFAQTMRLRDFNIKIGFDQKKINGKTYNIVYFLDNGPGISPDKMDKLFKVHQ